MWGRREGWYTSQFRAWHGQHGIPRDTFADKIFLNMGRDPIEKRLQKIANIFHTELHTSLYVENNKYTSFEWNIRGLSKTKS